jgi:hypothetical protein
VHAPNCCWLLLPARGRVDLLLLLGFLRCTTQPAGHAPTCCCCLLLGFFWSLASNNRKQIGFLGSSR